MKLPQASGKEVIDALVKAGFIIHRIRGSHYILKHPETHRRVTVPYHRSDLAPLTLRSILRQAGISSAEFIDLL